MVFEQGQGLCGDEIEDGDLIVCGCEDGGPCGHGKHRFDWSGMLECHYGAVGRAGVPETDGLVVGTG